MTEQNLREQRRAKRLALSRDQVLEAAEQIFARDGFHEASLREIAGLAEYSVGAVYNFFPGKDAIYQEVFRNRGSEFMPRMRQILDSRRPPREQLLELADWQVAFFRDRPNFARLVLRGGTIAPPLAEPSSDTLILENFQEANRLQADMFERGQRAGEFRAGPPELLARMFSGLVSAYQMTELESGRPPMTDGEFHALLQDLFVR